ncbi:MAG: C-terminal binding protein [Acidobacteria bacterium]|nr:C-terminal binding protein [Acidobacteriota bacterium]
MFKVVAVDSVRMVPTVEKEILAEAGAELVTADCHGEEDVIRATGDAHALLVSLSPITRRVIASWSQARVIARYGIGVDTVDLKAATDHGIFVTNVPDFCYDEVSDTAMSLILAVTRKVVRMHSLVSRGVYNRKLAMPVYKARGRTLGLLAFGRIARSVARKAAPFGYRVLAHDPYVQPESLAGQAVELVGLEELLARSDVLSIHVPLTAETRHLIGEPQLRLMKPTARGPVVDQKALTRALQEGWIAGAGLDVLEKEPPDPGDPILGLDNVVLTPHYASYTEEAYVEVREKAARQVVQVLRGEVPTYLVNREVLKRKG